MKIHGTAKGGALSTKDFGVAFGGAVADVCSFRADFSSSSGWTSNRTSGDGTPYVEVNTSNENLEYSVINSATTSGASSYDLGVGNVSNSEWIMRFKVHWTLAPNDVALTIMISSTQNALSSTSADRIGFFLYNEGGNWSTTDFGGYYTGKEQFWTDGSAWGGSTGVNDTSITASDDQDLYIEIKRTSTTAMSIRVTESSDYTGGFSISTSTLPSTVIGLRYLTFQNGNTGAGTAIGTGEIETLTFNNDTTEACSSS